MKRSHSALTTFPSIGAASKPLKFEQSLSRCTDNLPCYSCFGALSYTSLIGRGRNLCLYDNFVLVRSLSSPVVLKLQI